MSDRRAHRISFWTGVLSTCVLGVTLPQVASLQSRLVTTGDVLASAPPEPDEDEGADFAVGPDEDVDATPESGGGMSPANDDIVNWAQPAPVSVGSPENPFANTCDGRAIGFAGSTGERPRIDFKNVPAGAVMQCRTAPVADIGRASFAACDKGDGTKPLHIPDFTAEGTYRTEVRSMLGGVASPVRQVTYYVHHSLDRVACCQASQPDAAWFAAARLSLRAAGAFDGATTLANPFIQISARTAAGDQTESLLSLRRTFRLSPDNTLLLIRRTMASRRTLQVTRTNSCVGLAISVPSYGINPADVPACPSRKQSEFMGGRADAKCPSIYCTVSTCRASANGCVQVTHTFNRGPGQQPWVVTERPQCASPSVVKFTDYRCDAYVLNRAGQGVCLSGGSGAVRAVGTVTSATAPLGLAVLKPQASPRLKEWYVFSAKTTRKAGIDNVLFLPR